MGQLIPQIIPGFIVALVSAIIAYYLGGVRERQKRKREARERERKTIVYVIKRLERHQVLEVELDHIGEFYGRPKPMIAAVKEMQDDLVFAESELDENHRDTHLLQTMTESCKEFLRALEPLANEEALTSGGPDFYRAIEEQHSTFREAIWKKIAELRKRNDIKS